MKIDISLAGNKRDMNELKEVLKNIRFENIDNSRFKNIIDKNAKSTNRSYKAIYNRNRKISKYGVVDDKHELIEGQKYIYDKDSLIKIEIYKNRKYLRDSVLVK